MRTQKIDKSMGDKDKIQCASVYIRELEQKLAIAVETLSFYAHDENWYETTSGKNRIDRADAPAGGKAKRALKKIGG